MALKVQCFYISVISFYNKETVLRHIFQNQKKFKLRKTASNQQHFYSTLL